jgi:hypothetical protein
MPDSLEELLSRVSPALEIEFARHHVPTARALEIVDEVSRVLVRKRKDLESPDEWLLEMVRRRLAEERSK